MTLIQAMERRSPMTTPEGTLRSVHEQSGSERVSLLPAIEATREPLGLMDLFDSEDVADVWMAAGPKPEMVRRMRGRLQ